MFSNTDVIYLEFPFLKKIIPRAKVSQASIRRWDEDFLQEHSIHTEEFATFVKEIRFLNSDGSTVSIVGKRTLWEFLKEGGWYQSAGWYQYENVSQALVRIGDKAKLVRYAVQFEGSSFTLYKLPKGFSNVVEWSLSEMEIARNRSHQNL